jgi:hypothetical protein
MMAMQASLVFIADAARVIAGVITIVPNSKMAAKQTHSTFFIGILSFSSYYGWYHYSRAILFFQPF